MLDLRRLRVLHEFAQCGSIAATAVALGYSASAVSQQLAVLEREAGAALLIRTARSAELTDAGHRLAAHAGRILGELEAAEADIAAHAGIPSGRVVMSVFPTAALALAPLAASRLRRYPDLRLVVRQAAPGRGMERLRAGEVELALVDDWTAERTRPQQSRDTLTFVGLLDDPLVLVVPCDHPACSGPIDLAGLADQPWIAAPPDEPSRRALDTLFAEVGSQPRIAWEFQGLDTVVGLVAQGLGIAVAPRMALASRERDVVIRDLPSSAPSRTVYAAIRRTSINRPAVAAVLNALREAASEHMTSRVGSHGSCAQEREQPDSR